MPIDIFISYSHKDKELCEKLLTHLSNLRNQGIIHTWYDGDISAGSEWETHIVDHLASARIILLLISADFLASSFCYSIEMKQALARHEAHQARVIPIVLRPVDWSGAPFARLQMLPAGARPVIEWTVQDRAFTNIIQGIKLAIDELSHPASPEELSRTETIARTESLDPKHRPAQLPTRPGVSEDSLALLRKQVRQRETAAQLERLLVRAYVIDGSLKDLQQQLDDGDLDIGQYKKMEAKQKRQRGEILLEVRNELKGYDEKLDAIMQNAISGGQSEPALMDQLAQVAQQHGLAPALIESLIRHNGSFLSWLIEVGKEVIAVAD